MTEARHQAGSPQSLQTGFSLHGLQAVGGADFHALAAAQAFRKEGLLVFDAGRADETGIFGTQAQVGAQQDERGSPDCETLQKLAA